MNTQKLDFPQEIEKTLRKRIKQSIKMTFYDGARIQVDNFNISILEPYKVLFKKGRKIILVFITKNELYKKAHYNFFTNIISEKSKHSLNQVINIINGNL